MSKLILSIADDEMDIFKKQYVNLADLRVELDKLMKEGESIDKRKRKAYKLWKDKYNFLVDVYNVRSGFAYYKKIEE